VKYGLGRRPSPPDARDYRLAALVAKLEPGAQLRIWPTDADALNQEQTPHCVGAGWCGWGNCLPVDDQFGNDDLHEVYYEAKVYDGQPKGSPDAETGSTVRSGAKAMRARGRIAAYYFAESIAEAAEFVANHGPVVLGIDWYEGFTVPLDGVIVPTGKVIGGHCILWRGVDGPYAVLRNSWGKGWGKDGDCRIRLDYLTVIWAHQGEAAAATEAPLAAPAPVPQRSLVQTLIDFLINLFRK